MPHYRADDFRLHLIARFDATASTSYHSTTTAITALPTRRYSRKNYFTTYEGR